MQSILPARIASSVVGVVLYISGKRNPDPNLTFLLKKQEVFENFFVKTETS
jgi:hypothetical protein